MLVLVFVLADIEPAHEGPARHAIAGSPGQVADRWDLAVTVMWRLLVPWSIFLGVVLDGRDPAADIFAVNGPATLIENEISAQNHENAIAGFEGLAARIAIENVVDCAIMRFVDEMTFLGKQAGPRTLLLGGRAWLVSHIDWPRRVAYVKATDTKGRSRWKGERPGLGFRLC